MVAMESWGGANEEKGSWYEIYKKSRVSQFVIFAEWIVQKVDESCISLTCRDFLATVVVWSGATMLLFVS